jgi:hypothetical protein
MSKKQERKSMGRRDFFRKAGLGAGVAGAAVVGLSAAKGRAVEPSTPRSSGAGYRETEHVKKFYQLARF